MRARAPEQARGRAAPGEKSLAPARRRALEPKGDPADGPHQDRAALCAHGRVWGQDGHRGRLGPLDPRHEELRLRRAERRQLLQGPAGRHEPREARQLRGGRGPHRWLRPHHHRRARAHAGPPAAVRAPGQDHRGRGRGAAGLPHAEEAPDPRVPAHPAAPAQPHQPVPRGVPRAQRRGVRHPPLLPGARLRLRQHAHHHRVRRRGCRRDVPRHHDRPGQPAAHPGRQGRLQPGLLRQADQPHRLRPAPG